MLGHIARSIGQQMSTGLKGINILKKLSKETHRHLQSPFQICRVSMMSLWPFSAKPQDFSQPNSSWSPKMLTLYEHYNSLCEKQTGNGEEETGNGEKKRGPWRKLPSYNRTIKYATGGIHLSKLVQAKARLFTRCIEEEGAAFEYVAFINKEEKTCVCVFQAGHLLEGAPGHVHGGAIATMIDTVTGTLAGYLSGPVMTAYLNTNYRSPVPLGSVLLIHSSLDRIEGKKIFVNCKVTSGDESKLHTEATALFVSINMGPLFGTQS